MLSNYMCSWSIFSQRFEWIICEGNRITNAAAIVPFLVPGNVHFRRNYLIYDGNRYIGCYISRIVGSHKLSLVFKLDHLRKSEYTHF